MSSLAEGFSVVKAPWYRVARIGILSRAAQKLLSQHEEFNAWPTLVGLSLTLKLPGVGSWWICLLWQRMLGGSVAPWLSSRTHGDRSWFHRSPISHQPTWLLPSHAIATCAILCHDWLHHLPSMPAGASAEDWTLLLSSGMGDMEILRVLRPWHRSFHGG